MTKRADWTAHRFGRWMVLRFEARKGQSRWWCRCDCGTEKSVATGALTAGLSQSCGCLHREIISRQKLIDITGKRFGRLTVLARSGHQGTHILWWCRCDCGNECRVIASNLHRGHTNSCGCFHKERAAISGALTTRHGEARSGHETTEYRSWSAMMSRCNSPTNEGWDNYGGRGIAVCERWRSYVNFLADMGRKPSPAHSIDRIDVNGNYEFSNCRWATPKEQMNNRRPYRFGRIENFSDAELLAELRRRGLTPEGELK